MMALRPLLALALSPLLLAAGPATPDAAVTLAGRYYHQFPNAMVTGEKYQGENVVEIVPVEPRAAYVRVHLDYANGHSCGFWWIAQAQGDALVARKPEDLPGEKPCVLTVRHSGKSLLLDDDHGSCSSYCGARGTLTNVSLPFASKRPISYLARLKTSRQYGEALAGWRKQKPAKP